MAISTAQYIDLLFKKLQGVAKTATAAQKSAANESIASPPLLRGDIVWVQSDQIPGSAAVVSGVTQAYLTTSRIECTPDPSVPTIGGISPTWLTNLTDWIPQEFGSTWPVKVWIDNTGASDPTATGTQIFAPGIGGVGEFYFDPMAGLLNFIGETIPANLTAGKSIFITGYRYVGLLGVTNLPSGTSIGNIEITGNTIASLDSNGDIVLDPNGTGNVVVFSGNLNIPSGNITANYLYGNGYYLSGISGGGPGSYGNANVVALLADFGNNIISTTGNITSDYVYGNGYYLTGISGGASTYGNANVVALLADFGNNTVSTTGNITGDYFVGNGALLTGIASTYGNANVANYLANFGSNPISTTGNVTGNYFVGNGALLTGIASTYGNANVVSLLSDFGSNSISTTGNITGNYFVGNGALLTGIASTYGNANVVSLLADFGNNTVSTTGNITGDYFVGNGALLTGITSTPALTVSNWYTGNIISGNISNVEFLRFNANSGITVSDLGNNSALVTLGSSFKTWEVAGQSSLVAVGEDTVKFVAGNNIVITTNANAVPQEIEFATSNNIAAETFSATGNITGGNVITDNVVGGSVTITATSGQILLSAFANVNANSGYINNVASPVQPSDAANKSYVDAVAQGLHIHPAANLATTSDLASWLEIDAGNVVYNQPGPEGVGATLTFVGNSLTALDGQSVTSGMRLLVKNQANAVTNGVYSTTANLYVITRSVDAELDAELKSGDFLFVQAGNINGDTGWVQTTDNVVIGTSNITFVQFSSAGGYTAGTGLGLNGNEFYIANTAVTPGSYGNATSIATFTVNQQGQLTAANVVTVTASADQMTGNTLNSNVLYSNLNTVGTLANLSVLGNIVANSSISITGGGNFIMDGGNIDGAVIIGGTF